MSLLDSITKGLFGTSSQLTTVPNTLQSSLNPQQTQAQDYLMALLGASGSSVFPNYTGQLSAPLSSLQSSSLEGLSQAGLGATQAAGGTGNTQSTAMNALNNILTTGAQNYQPYYQANVVQPLTQQFEQTTLPNIVSALGGSLGGPQSTAAMQGVTQAANNFENTLASANTSLAFNTAQQAAQNQLTAANESTAVSQAPINTLTSLLSAGAVPQQTQQTADTAAYQNYLTQMGFTQQDITNLLSFLNTQTQTAANQHVVMPGQSGALSAVLGNAGLGSALGGWLGGGSAAAGGAAGGAAAGAGSGWLDVGTTIAAVA